MGLLSLVFHFPLNLGPWTFTRSRTSKREVILFRIFADVFIVSPPVKKKKKKFSLKMGGNHGQDGHPVLLSAQEKKKKNLPSDLEIFCITPTMLRTGGSLRETGAILMKDSGLKNMRQTKGEPVCALQN